MASKIFQTNSLSTTLILSYVVTISLPPVSISHNLSLAAVIAILCLLVEISQRHLLKGQFNKHLLFFAAPLLLIWLLGTSVGIFSHFDRVLFENFPKIIHQPIFFNLVFFIFLAQIFIGNQQFMMIAVKIFMTFSTAVAIFYIIIVALFSTPIWFRPQKIWKWQQHYILLRDFHSLLYSTLMEDYHL